VGSQSTTVTDTMLFSPMVRYGVYSDKGRREENQDSFFIHPEGKVFSFGIADGAGGHQFGRHASELTVQALKSEFKSNTEDSIDYIKRLVEKKIEQVNSFIFEEGSKRNITMATTLSLLVYVQDQMLISNIGDTKVFLIRNGAISCLSAIHTLAFQEYEQGKITLEQLENHKFKHVLTKSIGGSRETSPSIKVEKTYKHDVFLICSDGLYNYMREDELLQLFQNIKEKDLNQLCQQCVQQAFDKGSDDNITLMAIEII
jgi:PPM family protein phosphatase